MSIPSCTLVTCNFYVNDETRPLSICFTNMKILLEVPCYLVIFCDKLLYELARTYRKDLGLEAKTKFIVMDMSEIPSFQYKDKILSNREKYWPTRDPRASWQSHLLNAYKVKFLEQIIDENPFSTVKFAWIDANLGDNGKKLARHGFHQKDFLKLLHKCEQDPNDTLRIQVINCTCKKYIQDENLAEFYQTYRWIVGTCFFVCGALAKDILQERYNVFLDHTEKGYGHGDEMFWLPLLEKYYDRIKKGYGDYNDTLTNFITPTHSHPYIFYMILKNYFDFGYFREAYDCAKELIKCYDNFELEILDYNLYLGILFSLYVASYHYKREEASFWADRILQLAQDNAYFKKHFEKQEQFIRSQFAHIGK